MLAARFAWTSLSSLRFDSVGGWTSSILSAHRSTPSRCDGAPFGGPAPRLADRLWRPSAPLTRRHPPGMRNLDTHGGVEPPGSAFAAQCSPGELTTCVIWRPQRGSNPHSQIDNLVSWPLDDESSWWTWPDSNRLLPRARRMPCRWTTGPVVAGVGLAPTCMAYETRLELPPANPRWLQRQDSNLHMAAYETALEPFQARCSAGGVVGI